MMLAWEKELLVRVGPFVFEDFTTSEAGPPNESADGLESESSVLSDLPSTPCPVPEALPEPEPGVVSNSSAMLIP